MFKVWIIYLYRETLKNFLFVILLFLSFLLVIEVFEKLSAFLVTNKPFFYFIKYLFWKTIVNIYYVYPYALILSFILTLFLLGRSAELLALLTLGFKREEIYRKIILLLFLLSLLGEIVLNLLVPGAYFSAQKTWNAEIEERKSLYLIFRDELFFEGDGFFLVGRPLEPKGEYLSEMVVVFFNRDMQVERVLWAGSGIHREGRWVLKEVTLQRGETNFRPELYQQLESELPFSPQMLVLVEKPVRFLSIGELYRRYEFLKLAEKPMQEIWSELLNRALNLSSGLLLGVFPLYLFFLIFSPRRLKISLITSLLSFLLLTGLFLFIQTISVSKLFLALLVTSLWLFTSIAFVFKRFRAL